MKRTVLLLLSLVSIMASNASNYLLEFGTNHFDGWIYTQSIIEISNSNISQDNINLYWDYALISPEVTAPSAKIITVNVTGRTKSYEEPEYSNALGKVSVQLINENDSLLNEVRYTFKKKEQDRNFQVDFDVTDASSAPFKLRLSCPDANIESRFSVRKVQVSVKEYNLSGVAGDVNNDGVVTSADITALYDYLLNNDTSKIINGDVNTDGDITSADVTDVYNILLGVM